jgi:hypothetical protein
MGTLGGGDDVAQHNIAPPNYKTEILELMRTYLNDPKDVRDAGISQPAVASVPGIGDRYAVCVRYNAKKANGQYAGSKDSLVTFWDGRLDRITDADQKLCKDVAYVPFPELQQLTR